MYNQVSMPTVLRLLNLFVFIEPEVLLDLCICM